MMRKLIIVVSGLFVVPCALHAEWGQGLAGEKKNITVPVNQQSGWNGGAQCAVSTPGDADGDNIPDEQDECPNTPFGIKVDATGCSVSVRAIEDNWVLNGIQFETNSDKITAQSHSTLDEAAEILKVRSRVRVEIQGHADSVGDATFNKTLSEHRAQSVKSYLVRRGVRASQLETRGFGEAVPVSNNQTNAGRAENRCIEFKVLSR